MCFAKQPHNSSASPGQAAMQVWRTGRHDGTEIHVWVVGLGLSSPLYTRKGCWKHKLLGRKGEMSEPSWSIMCDQELLAWHRCSSSLVLVQDKLSGKGPQVPIYMGEQTPARRLLHKWGVPTWDAHLVLLYLYATVHQNFRHSTFQRVRGNMDFRATTQPLKPERIFNSEL